MRRKKKNKIEELIKIDRIHSIPKSLYSQFLNYDNFQSEIEEP